MEKKDFESLNKYKLYIKKIKTDFVNGRDLKSGKDLIHYVDRVERKYSDSGSGNTFIVLVVNSKTNVHIAYFSDENKLNISGYGIILL